MLLFAIAACSYLLIGFVLSTVAYINKWSDGFTGPMTDADELFVNAFYWPLFLTMLLLNKWKKFLDKRS